jgi:hypothetical protein
MSADADVDLRQQLADALRERDTLIVRLEDDEEMLRDYLMTLDGLIEHTTAPKDSPWFKGLQSAAAQVRKRLAQAEGSELS